uniref:Uncharacterized protein n=1 Tax=Caenorhabditis japonica TaxID=281687 RepID=A0A8R1IGG5_CAEJA
MDPAAEVSNSKTKKRRSLTTRKKKSPSNKIFVLGEEVENILWEVTQGELGKAPLAVKSHLGDRVVAPAAEDFEGMAQRLAELRD